MKIKATDAIREIMTLQGKKVSDIAKAMPEDVDGKEVPIRRISERLSQDNISVKVLDEMLRVLGYKVVLMPADESVPKNSFTVK